jgi:hypothetical protein
MKSKYFTTSDGQEFYTETNAINHARSLEDRNVTAPYAVELEVVDPTDETGEDTTGEDEAPKVNIRKYNKAQLIAFAADNELTIDETATNAVMLAAIEAQLIEKNPA